MNKEQIEAATEAAIEAAKEVGLCDRLAGAAQIAEAQEDAGWFVEHIRPYPDGRWPVGEVTAVRDHGKRAMIYQILLDPDLKRWHHGLMRADESSLHMAVVPAGVVISPDFARRWLAERTSRSREDAREALQRELLRKAETNKTKEKGEA